MSHDQAAQELFNAIQADTGRTEWGDEGQMAPPRPAPAEPAPAAPAPAEPAPESNPAPPEASATPEGEEQPDGATPAEPADSFTKLDPNSIPEDLQPYYKAMQADYVRKTQSLADQRKQYESLGSADELTQAAELYRTLQTPEGAVQFHNLLSQQLQQLGLSPAQADAAATQQVQQAQEVVAPVAYEDDPEVALQALRGEMEQMRSELRAEREAAQREQQMLALAGETMRQEAAIREGNPHYDDEDMNAIYEMAAFHNGNLLQAQQRYEEVVSSRLAKVLNSKSQAAATPAVQTVAAPTHAQEPVAAPRTLDEAHRAAMEHLRQLAAQG